MRKAVWTLFCAALTLGVGAVSAHADTYLFSEMGATDTFSFELTTPLTLGSLGMVSFTVLGVDVTLDGVTSSTTVGFDNAGVLYFDSLGFQDVDDPAINLFTGSLSDPGFDPGTYSVQEVSDASVGTLTITDLSSSSPVPEPSTLALFGTGILGMAGVARRRIFRG